MLFEVERRDEPLVTVDALIASFHDVYLWLGVPVKVRLGDALVVAEAAEELTYSCNGLKTSDYNRHYR